MPDCLAVSREPGRSVREIPLTLHVADREAKVGPVAQAVHALAALRREEGHDVVAGRKRGDALADLFDDARTLVAQHGRCVTGGIGTRGGVEIGVADPAGDQSDQRLTGLRSRQLDLLDLQRGPELLQNGGLDPHAATLSRRRRRRASPGKSTEPHYPS